MLFLDNQNRSIPLYMFCVKEFLKIYRKTLVPESLFKETATLLKKSSHRPATLLKRRSWQRFFPVNFAKFHRAPFLPEHLPWLLLREGKCCLSLARTPFALFNFWFKVLLWSLKSNCLSKKAVTKRCSMKKMFLEVSQNSQETPVPPACNFIIKETLAQVFSCGFLRNF